MFIAVNIIILQWVEFYSYIYFLLFQEDFIVWNLLSCRHWCQSEGYRVESWYKRWESSRFTVYTKKTRNFCYQNTNDFFCRKQGPQSRKTVHTTGGGAGCSQPHSGCYWCHSIQAIQQNVSIVNVYVLKIIYSINVHIWNIMFKKKYVFRLRIRKNDMILFYWSFVCREESEKSLMFYHWDRIN